jgi:GT2 family glycosyltransferase
LIDFSIIAPISNNLKFPNYKFKKENNNKLDIINPFKVKSVDGYAMLLNLKKIKKFKDFYFFDENFFLYLENDDLCKRMKQIDDNIYVVPKAKINHLGGQAVEPKYKDEVEYTRNWHWMWSKFYYNKKHYGYFNAVYKTLSNLISAIFKIIYYLVTGNKHKKKIYEMRFFGLLNSMLGNKSFYRPNLKN